MPLGIENIAKWKLLLFVFILIIGSIFVLENLSTIESASTMTDITIIPVLGMFGSALIVISLVYGAENIKEGEYKNAVEFGLVGVVLGLALVVAWLW